MSETVMCIIFLGLCGASFLIGWSESKKHSASPPTVTLTASSTFSWPASVYARDAEVSAIKKRLAETIAERLVESDIGELECDGDVFRLTVRCLTTEE